MNFLRNIPWWVYVLVGIAAFFANKRTGNDDAKGKVIGIVGRMGSGKSYMATRIAWSRMWRGAKIVSNFTMHLECPPSGHKKYRCPCKLAGRWQRFEDWPDLLPLSNAVVIIDEVDLYAPSHNFHAITDEVRGKLKMARKYKLDIYWITQHEARVNRILKDQLSNEIAVCRSYFGGKYFSAKFYEPHEVRRRKKHTYRQGYFLNKKIANLYDTLELITGSEYAGDETMKNYNQIMRRTQENRPCIHDRKAHRATGTCTNESCYPWKKAQNETEIVLVATPEPGAFL